MAKKNPPQILSNERLEFFSTPRLLRVLKSVRAFHSAILHTSGMRYRCCEICREWTKGDEEDYKREVLDPAKPYGQYIGAIKGILAAREHVKK